LQLGWKENKLSVTLGVRRRERGKENGDEIAFTVSFSELGYVDAIMCVINDSIAATLGEKQSNMVFMLTHD
jgi:hypothetical protein